MAAAPKKRSRFASLASTFKKITGRKEGPSKTAAASRSSKAPETKRLIREPEKKDEALKWPAPPKSKTSVSSKKNPPAPLAKTAQKSVAKKPVASVKKAAPSIAKKPTEKVEAPAPAEAAKKGYSTMTKAERELRATTASAPIQGGPIKKVVLKYTIGDLTNKMCHWPIGKSKEDIFYFCGDPVKPGSRYCPEHCKEAYEPGSARNKED